jgi:hypothetical protein
MLASPYPLSCLYPITNTSQNWFQNRRAKAKQERKQEEYEARRAAEKAGSSQPHSPADASSCASEVSSALFPEMSPSIKPSQPNDDDADHEDAICKTEALDSTFASQSADSNQDDRSELQSPLSYDVPRSNSMTVGYTHPNRGFDSSGSIHDYTSLSGIPGQSASEQCLTALSDGVSSPQEQMMSVNYQPDNYLDYVGAGYPNTALPYFRAGEHDSVSEGLEREESGSPGHEEQQSSISQGLPTPTDTFKSPPPPANIASRRNIPRPATLQVASNRSRSYNLGCGPKTGMDGLRRPDPTSPATAMRRIASAGGNMAGRIQKAGPRSPLFLSRNTEAYLQYHSRSPVAVLSATFSATPPTPMTPAVITQSVREPTVSSNCSDDDAFMVGNAFSAVDSLKTPPETPSLIASLSAHHFTGHTFNTPGDFATPDQPLLTPYFQSEFPDLRMRHVPSYVEMGDNSVPSTPLYPNMMNSAAPDSCMFAGSMPGNTQYDWDANESITSAKSSPEQPRTRQIQFTQNITPDDYNAGQER